MRSDVTLSIVIVNRNSTEFARQCITSIYQHTRGLPFEILVVDNASTAADAHRLKHSFPHITLIKSKENLGFARANNLGATQATGEFLLFLNPDTKLIRPALEIMVETLKSRSDAGALGCKLLNEDLSVQTSCIQTFPTILNQTLDADALRARWPRSALWGTFPLFSATSEAVAVEVVSGACLLIRHDVFRQVGMFSEDYFMYAEDVDLCRKTVRAGYRNYYTGATQLIHYGGKSSVPATATVMKWRSILHYCQKHRGRTYTFLFRSVMAVVATCRLSLLAAAAIMKMPAGHVHTEYSAADKWKAILATLLSRTRKHQQYCSGT